MRGGKRFGIDCYPKNKRLVVLLLLSLGFLARPLAADLADWDDAVSPLAAPAAGSSSWSSPDEDISSTLMMPRRAGLAFAVYLGSGMPSWRSSSCSLSMKKRRNSCESCRGRRGGWLQTETNKDKHSQTRNPPVDRSRGRTG